MTTLADLTPEERYECVGMWVEDGRGNLRILADTNTGANGLTVRTFSPILGRMPNHTSARLITPRYDLPRAWIQNGEPA